MSIVSDLLAKGVVIHAPQSVCIEGVRLEQIEPGVEIFGSTHICGADTQFGAGTRIGMGGGGFYENVAAGRGVELRAGIYSDCVFLDGAQVRSNAEVREGCVLEEGAELGHTVGIKQTILMPQCIAGSLVNFCDALLCGGVSRREHSEIGSCMALYNYTPWGNKFASQFGDVPRGVMLREAPIFIGGQCQIVSPVKVGFGSVIAASAKVQRDVGEGRLICTMGREIDVGFDPLRMTRVLHKIVKSCEYVGNLYALLHWYKTVRRYFAGKDAFLLLLYAQAERQICAGIEERIKRIQKCLDKVPASLERHVAEQNAREVDEHRYLLRSAESIVQTLRSTLTLCDLSELCQALDLGANAQYTDCIRALSPSVAASATKKLEAVVAFYALK